MIEIGAARVAPEKPVTRRPAASTLNSGSPSGGAAMNDTNPYTIHLVSPTPKFSPKELLAPELEIVVLKRAAVHFGLIDADHALGIVPRASSGLSMRKS